MHQNDDKSRELPIFPLRESDEAASCGTRTAGSLENLYRRIIDSIADGYYEVDLRGNFTFISNYFDQLGYSRDELIGMNFANLVPAADRQSILESYRNVFLTGRALKNFEFPLMAKNGEQKRVCVSAAPIEDNAGVRIGFRGIFQDVTAFRQAEAALRQSEERYRTIIENIQEGYYELDREGRLVFFNDALASIFSFDRKGMIDLDYRTITSAENLEELQEKFRRVWETGQANPLVEWEIKTDDGKIIYTEISISLRRDERGRPIGFRGILRDITDRHNREILIKQMAYFDPLTELPNRRLFEDRFQLALAGAARRRKKLALLLIDLDRFKEVNDTYGHEAGDRLLQEVGRRLSGLLRKGDTVARLGGDEFVVLLNDINRTGDALKVAQKILREIGRPIAIKGRSESVSVSIGISLYPQHDLDKGRLLNLADQAMYWAKKSGSCCKVYSANLAGRKKTTSSIRPHG